MKAVSARKKHKIYEMSPNYDKIREAILFVIIKAASLDKQVTRYDIVKTIFLADRAHLNKYGRPITFDNYVAMKHGPVPSFCYDALKGDKSALDKCGGALWSMQEHRDTQNVYFLYNEPKRQYDENILSESDVEELSDALVVVKALGFGQIRKLTHDDLAYVDAWEDNDLRKQFPMSYALLFDSINDEMAERVSFASKHF